MLGLSISGGKTAPPVGRRGCHASVFVNVRPIVTLHSPIIRPNVNDQTSNWALISAAQQTSVWSEWVHLTLGFDGIFIEKWQLKTAALVTSVLRRDRAKRAKFSATSEKWIDPPKIGSSHRSKLAFRRPEFRCKLPPLVEDGREGGGGEKNEKRKW